MNAPENRAGSAARSLAIDPALRAELDALYADYAAALDEARYDDWLTLFAADCSYTLKPRENHDRGLPLATLWLDSRGMLADRIYAITQTLYHQPYLQRHVIGPVRVLATRLEDPEAIALEVEVGYAVFRTKSDALSDILSVGRYLDRVVREAGELRFASKLVVFDSALIPNSVIYPV